MIEYAFADRLNGDVVNMLSLEQVVYFLSISIKDEPVMMQSIPCCAECGVVLSDPYGRGAFQK